MSTPVKCTQTEDYITLHANRSGEVQVDYHGSRIVCMNVKPEDLLNALKNEGILPEKTDADKIVEQVKALEREWYGKGAYAEASELRQALAGEPVFGFPTGIGAVIEGHRFSDTTVRFLRNGLGSWEHLNSTSASRSLWTEEQIRDQVKGLKVLSEGVDL